jgi:hypothetical protein
MRLVGTRHGYAPMSCSLSRPQQRAVRRVTQPERQGRGQTQIKVPCSSRCNQGRPDGPDPPPMAGRRSLRQHARRAFSIPGPVNSLLHGSESSSTLPPGHLGPSASSNRSHEIPNNALDSDSWPRPTTRLHCGRAIQCPVISHKPKSPVRRELRSLRLEYHGRKPLVLTTARTAKPCW